MELRKFSIPDQWKVYFGQLSKYKYIALVVLVGILLLLWPTGKNGEKLPETEAMPQEQTAADMELEARLESVLSEIAGAGRCRVMLTVSAGAETVYQTDTRQQSSADGTSLERTTALTAAGSATELPLVVQTINPVYQGALVVCSGADSAAVRLSIVDAVSGLTGLGADQITVIKMKS